MNIAVFSDIHGNYVALQAVIDYAINQGADTFVFLGDYVGELAYPQKTMEMLYSLREKYRCFFIRGNKEDYWLKYKAKGERGWKEFNSTTGALYYTYHNLKPRDLDFFMSLSYKEEIEFDGLPQITICHGSPQKVNEKLLPDSENTFVVMDNNVSDYILCGHTHVQGKIEHNGKKVLNPGAVGISHHCKGKAQFMMLRGASETWVYEFVSLEYDTEKVILDLYSSGLSEKAPYWCKVSENLLRTGEIAHGEVLERAMTLCKKKYGECSWPNIPEECWQGAVSEMLR